VPRLDVVQVLPQLHGDELLRPAFEQLLEPYVQVGVVFVGQPEALEDRGRVFLLGVSVELRGDHGVLEVHVGVEVVPEVLDGGRRGGTLLEHVSGLMVDALPRVVASQSRPHAGLFGELAGGAAEDGFHGHPGDVVRMLSEELAEVQQELLLGRALGGAEAIVLYGRGELFGRVPEPARGDEEGDELLGVRGVELEVAAEDADGGRGRAAGEVGEAAEERPHAVVLRDGQGSERAVEDAASAGEEALLQERGGVHVPDARHPGHAGGQGALEGGVEGGVPRARGR
jgi:hypothetical protein